MHSSLHPARLVGTLVVVTSLVVSSCSGQDNSAETSPSSSSTVTSAAESQAVDEPTGAVEASTPNESDQPTASVETADAAEVDTSTAEVVSAASSTVLSDAVSAANDLIGLLSGDLSAQLVYDHDDPAITSSWSNLPACQVGGRAGIRHGDLSTEQVDATMAVADAVLSDEGLAEYAQIIAADEELGGGDGEVWDADCYYLAFFGTPSDTDPWAMQFGGHHYARTVTFADGDVTVTPAFTGVEPKSFTLDGETVEPLGDEAAAMFAIFDDLTDAELSAAELGGSLDEVLLGPGSDTFPATEGLALGDVSDSTRAATLEAIRTWVDAYDASLADDIMTSIEGDLDTTFVSWSNSIDVDTQGSYGRIDGPNVWIEFVNEGGVGSGDIHHHSVYRDKSADYGTAA